MRTKGDWVDGQKWIVYFNPGWTYDNDGQHIYPTMAKREALEILRGGMPCQCRDCKERK